MARSILELSYTARSTRAYRPRIARTLRNRDRPPRRCRAARWQQPQILDRERSCDVRAITLRWLRDWLHPSRRVTSFGLRGTERWQGAQQPLLQRKTKISSSQNGSSLRRPLG